MGSPLERFLTSSEIQGLNESHDTFWMSPDIANLRSQTINPFGITEVEVSLDPEELHPFKNPSISYINSTTRSRLAQLGGEVLPTIFSRSRLNRASVSVANHSERPIKLEEGTKFFYTFFGGKDVNGDELKDSVGSEILISGEKGEAWNFWTDNSDDVQGIELFLDMESGSFVEPSEDPIVLEDGESINHNRDFVDQYLTQPLPKSLAKRFWVAETLSVVNLLPGIHGVIAGVSGDFSKNGRGTRHLNSLLIQGGNTERRIRAEILSPTTEDLIPRSLVIRFVRG